jgi:ribonuclease HII
MNRYLYEDKLWNEGYQRIMGLDEVGRGCLCGPVVAAGVIIKPGERLNLAITDSKKLTEPIRNELAGEIKEKALFWSIKEMKPQEIDQYNILNASLMAMLKCTEEERAEPDYLLVDGNRFTTTFIQHTCVIKGDDKSASIGAASILAKVYRDEYMKKLHESYPYYGWDKNVGYPTKKHFKGLMEYGYTKHHRKSFKLRTDKVYGV